MCKSEIKLITWKATGIWSAVPYLNKELQKRNICGISEHWLLTHNKHMMNTVIEKYDAHVVTCKKVSTHNGRQYGRGGVAILWQKRCW